jgi:hypothetical protein
VPSARLAGHEARSHAPRMFVVTEAEAAAIRATFEQRGELAAAVELRRLFPGIHRHDAGAGMRSDHRGMEAAACDAAPVTRRHAGKSR